jgi:hypothetical protein
MCVCDSRVNLEIFFRVLTMDFMLVLCFNLSL